MLVKVFQYKEADAGIQGFKRGIRQWRQYGGFDLIDLIESNREAQQMVNNLLTPQSQQLVQQADADTNQNINDYFKQTSHDVGSKREPSAPDRNNKETNKDQQYIGGLDQGQKPVHTQYGKDPNEPHKVVDYKVTGQDALTARQQKILQQKEEQLNLDITKTHKIATIRILSQVQAQEQLKNKLGRKKKWAFMPVNEVGEIAIKDLDLQLIEKFTLKLWYIEVIYVIRFQIILNLFTTQRRFTI
ncbi:MAG: hypothetical protein EZS28_005032 [Streblomastix strix]|uniref:Uncharacterized protein n=1 Tax=Streblomastix strix TaxID=222440 RepID=A0A5J4WWL8_9EUKA|nr:MAG: hypothetical protein EZS28_005032 [Streblomastix strix]